MPPGGILLTISCIYDILTLCLTLGLLVYAIKAYIVYVEQARLARYTYLHSIIEYWKKTVYSLKLPKKDIHECMRYVCSIIMHTKDDTLSELLITMLSAEMRHHYNEEALKDSSQLYSEVIDFFTILEKIGYVYGSWKELQKTYDSSVKAELISSEKNKNRKH